MPKLNSWSAHILGYFAELSNRRNWSEAGAAPISFIEIKAWQEIMNVCLERWELKALLAIDKVWLEQQ